MSIYGYARVSSAEQNLDRQIVQLKQYVAEECIVVDKASGKNLDRPGYTALKGALGLRPGDTLYIVSLDRLSRNKTDLKAELSWFKDNNITLKVIDLPTSMIEVPDGQEWIRDMITNILVEVLASMAEQERLTIRKRQREGIDAAKAKGKHLGRPRMEIPESFQEIYEMWRVQNRITAKEAARRLQMSSTSFYRKVREFEGRN